MRFHLSAANVYSFLLLIPTSTDCYLGIRTCYLPRKRAQFPILLFMYVHGGFKKKKRKGKKYAVKIYA